MKLRTAPISKAMKAKQAEIGKSKREKERAKHEAIIKKNRITAILYPAGQPQAAENRKLVPVLCLARKFKQSPYYPLYLSSGPNCYVQKSSWIPEFIRTELGLDWEVMTLSKIISGIESYINKNQK